MIQLLTLGTFAVFVDGEERGEISAQPVRAALLLVLAVEREISRDRILALLWPDRGEERARHALRQTLYELRHDLGGAWVEAAGETLRASDRLTADAIEFLRVVEEGDSKRALELYRGPFLEGRHLASVPDFEQWRDGWEARLARLHRRACRDRIESLLDAGNLRTALDVAHRWCEVDASEDEAHHRVIELLDRLGRKKEALTRYERYRESLAEEGLSPLETTEELVARIRESIHESTELEPWPALAPGRPGSGRWRGGALALGLALLLGLSLVAGDYEEVLRLPAERIMVVPLSNRTGDPALEDLGRLTADWLAYGLARVPGLEVVPALDVLVMLRSGMSPREAALERRAGTLVTGSFYGKGERLEVHARIDEVDRDRVWHVLDPIRVDPADPEEGIEELRQRVSGALAVRGTPGLPSPAVLHMPTYEAFVAYMRGGERFIARDFEGAIPYLEQAFRIDSTFVRAELSIGAAYANQGKYAQADSVLRRLARKQDHMAPYELVVFEFGRASVRGDWEGRLRAARRAARLDPGGTVHYLSAGVALASGRPREALELYDGLDPDCPWAPGWLNPWIDLAGTHHVLGDHRAELALARRARRLYPDRIATLGLEAVALAAEGRVTAVRERVRIALESSWTDGKSTLPVLEGIAAELRAHGEEVVAREVLVQVVHWLDSPGGRERAEADPEGRARILILADRLAEADSVLTELPSTGPAGAGILGIHAIVAARRGDRDRAERMSRELAEIEAPYLFGRPTYWRAAVAAWSDRPEEALRLLRRAHGEGRPRGMGLHADPFLQPLWSSRAYARLVSDQS